MYRSEEQKLIEEVKNIKSLCVSMANLLILIGGCVLPPNNKSATSMYQTILSQIKEQINE